MYVERIPNRNSPPAVLLRESYREGDKIKKRTLANLSDWPAGKIEALRRVLRGEAVAPTDQRSLTLVRSLPHGHVASVLGTLRRLGLDGVLSQDGRQPARAVALCLAMIAARVIDPASKLATARVLDSETALARRHLKNGTLVLYDVTSTYFEGRTCELARFGYNRDGKAGKLQIVFGLLCTAEGCPVAVEVFEGNIGDPSTLASQVAKLKERFKLERLVLIGDRGMITAARLEETIKPAGLDWITALRAPGNRCAARTRSRSRSVASSTITRWPSTSPSPLRMTASPSRATRRRSMPKPPSTASTWCAPASRRRRSTPPRLSGPISSSPTPSAPSAASRPSTSRSVRSITAGSTACAPTCSYACSPMTLNGTCARLSSPSCSMITTRPKPTPPAPRSSPRPSARRRQTARPSPSEPRTACRSTASDPCSLISPPSPATPWRWPPRPTPPS